MNFFERIADYELRVSRNGELVFCPWGSAFGGKIIPTGAEERRIRQALACTYRRMLIAVSLPLVALLILGQFPYAVLWGLAGSIWIVVRRHRIVRGLDGTMDFLPFARRSYNVAHELGLIIGQLFLALFCSALAFAMFYSAMLSASPTAGLIGGAIFATCAAIALYAIVKKLLS